MKQAVRSRRKKWWCGVLWILFALFMTLITTVFIDVLRETIEDIERQHYYIISDYSAKASCLDIILFLILSFQLCVFAWYGFIRFLLGKPLLPSRRKSVRFPAGVFALLFGVLTVCLTVMGLRVAAEHNAYEMPVYDFVPNPYPRFGGWWGIAALLTAELFIAFAVIWLIGHKENKKDPAAIEP